MDTHTFTHAGGIVIRRTDDAVRVLVVRPSVNGHDIWVLPKGHIEPGEDPQAAALREVAEESGVIAADPVFAGHTAFRAGGEDVVCAFYAMRPAGDGPAEEDRERGWLTLDELRDAMPFPETLRLVERAVSGSG